MFAAAKKFAVVGLVAFVEAIDIKNTEQVKCV